jgi:hypothetical protein
LFDNGNFLSYVVGVALQISVVLHIFVGTMIFSSLLFIGVDDTWPVVLRYASSAMWQN